MQIRKDEHCTGCGACESVCPMKCIRMEKDEYGCLYPQVKKQECIRCLRCENVCPKEKRWYWKERPFKAYAAWNTDPEKRLASASGGIVSAIYTLALDKGYRTFGVVYEPGKKAKYIEVKTKEQAEQCRNSKYVFSDIRPILLRIKELVAADEKVIVPALPCQAAAVIGVCGGRKDNLIVLDIVCHGVCPVDYLNNHLESICSHQGKIATAIHFRDPAFGTHNYIFAIYGERERFYSSKVDAQDVYHYGYHRALTYRENCYHCEYARPERVGDITVSDFSGLGKIIPYKGNNHSVSCVLISSEKGSRLWNELVTSELVTFEERPLGEALHYEKNLKAPLIPHRKRSEFLRCYCSTANFEYAARKALRTDLLLNRVRYRFIKNSVSHLLPESFKKKIKKVLR